MQSKNVKSEQRFSAEKMRKVNLFETERMFADVYCLEPGQEQKAHAHAGADKIYYVLEGSGRFRIGDEEQELGPNHIVLAPADVEHGVRNVSSSRLALLVFMAPNPNRAK
ncbi:MAG TPA: cupin domain-containing protein [Blastocatellia bacterium]|nr:cupin domain-containing protein [Blastocatellia bacterium]